MFASWVKYDRDDREDDFRAPWTEVWVRPHSQLMRIQLILVPQLMVSIAEEVDRIPENHFMITSMLRMVSDECEESILQRYRSILTSLSTSWLDNSYEDYMEDDIVWNVATIIVRCPRAVPPDLVSTQRQTVFIPC